MLCYVAIFLMVLIGLKRGVSREQRLCEIKALCDIFIETKQCLVVYNQTLLLNLLIKFLKLTNKVSNTRLLYGYKLVLRYNVSLMLVYYIP